MDWVIMIVFVLILLLLGFTAAVLCIAGLLKTTIQEAIRIVATITISGMAIAVVVGSTMAVIINHNGGLK